MRLFNTHNATPATALRLMLAIVLAAAMSSCRPPAKDAATAPAPKPPRFQSISAYPAEITLRAGKDHHRILATGTNAGWEVHIDRDLRFTSTPVGVVKVDADGTVTGLKPGKAQVRVEADSRSAIVSVEVVPDSTGGQLGFTSDVLPVLSRSGCNAGGCHAKPEGQNHFKLSVFAYDPKGDYHAIVRDDRGRRVFPAAPEESLLLQKATLAVEHEGGQRFEPGSEPFKTLVEWIRQGMPYSLTNEVELVDIRVFPAERRYQKGSKQPLLVQARYSDDSVRDITSLADFGSNDKDVATVDEFGHVQVGSANGEGVIVVRFMGQVAVSRITVPADKMLPDSLYAALPVNNEIDRLVYNRLKGLGIAPSETCTDSEFIRRSSLDAIGTLPTPEQVKAFLADTDPAKRNKWIDQLLENPAYANHWAVKWGDLIRPNPSRVGVKPVYLLDLWLRDSFRQNKPYDQMVKELLTAEGSTHRYGPAAIFRDKRDPADASAFVSQIFMGVRMDCAKCHHHPNEKWSQDDYFQLAAFFTQTKHKGQGISAPISGEPEFIWYAPGGEVKNPVSGQVMKPKPPDGPVMEYRDGTDPRRMLAEWLGGSDNPFFGRATVNRIWGQYFGRGIVDPVDDIRASNPASNEPLLDWLARDFVDHGYDLKHLMRTIMQSRVYQQSAIPGEHNVGDTRHYSRSYRRRLPAEVLLDAVVQVTGVPDRFDGLAPGSRAIETWNHKLDSEFMDAFGRPNSSAECPCERDRNTSVVQALHLMNSSRLQSKIGGSEGRLKTMVDSNITPEELVTELYLLCYSRKPTPEELEIATKAFSATGATRKTAAEDVLWALINSAEFVFNH